jgi:hypothetical protein
VAEVGQEPAALRPGAVTAVVCLALAAVVAATLTFPGWTAAAPCWR